MQSALVATLARPDWWAMALAAFLVRGGIILVLLPIVSLPSTAGLTTLFAPALEALILGGATVQGVLIGTIVVVVALAALAAAGLAGSWLDLALIREAAGDEDLDLGWAPVRASVRPAFAIRLAAHLPTLVALGYGFIRIVSVAYQELTDPGATGVPVAVRVIERAPEALIVVVVAWIIAETVGSLAARRAAAGAPASAAFVASIRQVVGVRGLATLVMTSAVLVGIGIPFVFAASRAWEHLRGYLIDGVDAVQLAAALVVLVATWVLGLAVLGAGLAWRASAWTSEVDPG